MVEKLGSTLSIMLLYALSKIFFFSLYGGKKKATSYTCHQKFICIFIQCLKKARARVGKVGWMDGGASKVKYKRKL